jgi:hypothetical protein
MMWIEDKDERRQEMTSGELIMRSFLVHDFRSLAPAEDGKKVFSECATQEAYNLFTPETRQTRAESWVRFADMDL